MLSYCGHLLTDRLQCGLATVTLPPPPGRARCSARAGQLKAARLVEVLCPMPERAAPITHTRTDQAVIGILLETVRDPPGRTADCEYGGR